MTPSFETHFPIVMIDENTWEPAMFWVDRTTGEMIYMFHLEAAHNFETVTGIRTEEYHREMMGGYSKPELKELQDRIWSEIDKDRPEYDRLIELAATWKEQQS